MMKHLSDSCLDRRSFLAAAAACGAGLTLGRGRSIAAEVQADPPTRVITSGPKHHWFGYYDKLQFDPTNRFVLSNQVDFEHRTPRPDDTIRVGMVDTANDDEWIELGTSNAWGWQQGCMLQWRPETKSQIVWNDRDGDRFVCRLLDVETKAQKTLDGPIYTVSADGKFALSADFARIQIMRPGYGYVGLPDEHGDKLAPEDSGVFRVGMDDGKSELVLSLADVAKIPYQGRILDNQWHYFNHLLVSPDSQRFIVLHRWRQRDSATGKPSGKFTTRMITANVDGSDIYVLDPSGHTSHFIWRDPEHVCMWTKPEGRKAAFYLFKDKTREIEIVGEDIMTKNGHNTYLHGTDNEWILNDTYPDSQRMQRPYLYHVPTRRQVWLGAFHLPKQYSGEWRCDTHPRSSNDGRLVCIDSPHDDVGRQLHLINVSEIIN